jgi:type IV secretory pathway VirB6-like protein
MLEHCVVIDTSSDYSHISIDSPYFDKSCFDFKGDSKFTGTASNWTVEESIVPEEIFRLTSPIAQCVRETLKNIFLNIAGHSKCDDDYVGNLDFEYCATYKWQKGQDLNNITNDDGDLVYFSVFRFIQDKLYFLIQLFLILYVMLFGFKILISDKIIPRKEILENCLKIGVVIFFATGNAWQAVFFDLVYNLSTTFGNIILDLKDSRLVVEGVTDVSEEQSAQAQKCYFDPEIYDDNMRYVSLWDTLDCKLSQYLGLAPGLTVGNLAILIVSGYFTGIYGIYFASLLFTFAIMFLTIIYIVLYMFIVTSTMIIIMIFISPIIMVSILFEHTKDIFENWLKQLLETSTQLIILFSFVSMTIFLFDEFFVGSADFKENSPEPICECQCEATDGQPDENNARYFIEKGIKKCGIANDTGSTNDFVDEVSSWDGSPTKCSEKNEKAILPGVAPSDDARLAINCVNIYRDGLCGKGFAIRDPKADSLLCIMRINNHAVSQSGNLAAFGLIMPVLNIIFSPDRAVTLILTLIKIVLVVYIIKIMTGRIAAISSMLWGTKGLPSSIEATIKGLSAKIQSNFKKAVSAAGTVQQYGNRGMSKLGSKVIDEKSKAKNDNKDGKDSGDDKGGKDSGGDGKGG